MSELYVIDSPALFPVWFPSASYVYVTAPVGVVPQPSEVVPTSVQHSSLSRMMFSRNRGRRGGVYDYFVCIGRHTQKTNCELPYIQVKTVEAMILDYYGTIVLGPDLVGKIHEYLIKIARRRNVQAEKRAKRARGRVIELEKERRKLLQAHLAGAVPIDLLQEEQARITSELANAGAALANTEIHWEQLETNLQKALELSTRLDRAYESASATVRRRFNQAIFEVIYVDVDGIHARLAQPFRSLLDEDFLDRLEREWDRPTPDQGEGSNFDELVGAGGLEPSTSAV